MHKVKPEAKVSTSKPWTLLPSAPETRLKPYSVSPCRHPFHSPCAMVPSAVASAVPSPGASVSLPRSLLQALPRTLPPFPSAVLSRSLLRASTFASDIPLQLFPVVFRAPLCSCLHSRFHIRFRGILCSFRGLLVSLPRPLLRFCGPSHSCIRSFCGGPFHGVFSASSTVTCVIFPVHVAKQTIPELVSQPRRWGRAGVVASAVFCGKSAGFLCGNSTAPDQNAFRASQMHVQKYP